MPERKNAEETVYIALIGSRFKRERFEIRRNTGRLPNTIRHRIGQNERTPVLNKAQAFLG